MAISKLIYDWLMRIFASPKESGKITDDEAMESLRPHCKNIYLSDTYFSLMSKEEIAKFLDIDRTNFKKWENETCDCDNFSYQLMGYFSKWNYSFCFGIAWSDLHAFNIFIDDKKEIYVVEPQSDQILKLDEVITNPKYYPFKLVLI